jgi:hypothetical protein
MHVCDQNRDASDPDVEMSGKSSEKGTSLLVYRRMKSREKNAWTVETAASADRGDGTEGSRW